ncbi:DUF4398 domain-containing protein [Beggiatoa leptomitoformis]|uniref:DUF4398 domain-containing protein n=1 Tax=Beggiatoa leptomitoformis TaxID=288004 RepID=A0A2N9YC92_9GAMM|nr:DUF4398 domain-containing protein [Beggiatoa leptomitoformis]AUI68100.1 DUF4398 domain-containing protein [Beggiatoa leptomitoformis]QGX03453.1 DUF4398 domain-containing protein [Beggiatoa leptomitoformis]
MRTVPQSLGTLMLFLLTMGGCASVPIQEMSDARQALKAAQDIQAERYALYKLEAAKESLLEAEQNLESGNMNQARYAAVRAKEQAVGAHNVTIALDRAGEMWERLVNLGLQPAHIEIILQKAKASAQEGAIDDSLSLVEIFSREGRDYLNLFYLEQANLLIVAVRNHQTQLNSDQLATLQAAELAYQAGRGEEAINLIRNLHNRLQYSTP